MNEQGHILETHLEKTIITNRAQLSYKEAQDIIDDVPGINKKLKKTHSFACGLKMQPLEKNQGLVQLEANVKFYCGHFLFISCAFCHLFVTE